MVDARESQKALIALAQCNQQQHQACATSATAASLAIPFVSSAAGSIESNDSVGDASLSLTNSNWDIAQQDKDIRDLTKDLSLCAATFGHPSVQTQVANALADMACCNNPSEIDRRVDEESAKDCP